VSDFEECQALAASIGNDLGPANYSAAKVGAKAVKDMADLAQNNVGLWMDMQQGFLKAAGLGTGKHTSRKKTKG